MQTAWNKSAPIGAIVERDGVCFRLWTPDHEQVQVVIFDEDRELEAHDLLPVGNGYFSAFVPRLTTGARYKFRVDGEGPFPDPASRFQPDGVHGPSAVVDLSFPWSDDGWKGRPMAELIIYELHVGSATAEGTFDALIPRLSYFKMLGVTAIELMPIAEFAGARNWGYDGVSLYAPSRNYGGVEGLQRLVNAAHGMDLAVILDVVYNHLGPDGNYLRSFSTDYFTDRHHTPWGEAINYDGRNSRAVRDFFLDNALYWLREFHLDGLRLDATHEIKDDSNRHFIQELSERVRSTLSSERKIVLIAENECNDAELLKDPADGGWGLDGVWADDFHHQLRSAFAGDNEGYYADYTGSSEDIARSLERGWFYEGQPRLSTGKPWGTSAASMPLEAFVHCIQNHDQIGNRPMGDRLNQGISLAAYRAATTLLLLDAATPLIFMGQEWAASTPFLYFTDFDNELGRRVTKGRLEELEAFTSSQQGTSKNTFQDPQSEESFLRSKLNWEESERAPHNQILRLYRDLLALRRDHPALRERSRRRNTVEPLGPNALGLRRASRDCSILLVVVNLRDTLHFDLSLHALSSGCECSLLLASEDLLYGGAGARSIELDGTILRMQGPGAAVLQARLAR